MKNKPSKLDPHAERLEEWFLAGKSLKDAQEQLRLDGCAVSLGRLSDWWSRRQQERQERALLEQIATGARLCKEVESEFGSAPAPELKTLIALQRTLILRLSTEGAVDSEKLELVQRMLREVQKFARLEQLAAQNRIEERKLELLEKKAALADQAKGVLEDGALSQEERVAKMRAVFGM